MKAANAEPEIVTRNGKPISVIVPIKKYQEMIERLEDAEASSMPTGHSSAICATPAASVPASGFRRISTPSAKKRASTSTQHICEPQHPHTPPPLLPPTTKL